MLKILNFFKSNTGEVKVLNMRERFVQAQSEMNADLGEMPKISIDAKTRQIEITAPDQFPDEALALPAPETEAEKPEDLPESDAAEADEALKETEKAAA